MKRLSLLELEEQASKQGLLLRLQVRKPLGLWTLRLVVATQSEEYKIKILGEMKAWAYNSEKGLQLDTMQVREGAPACIGHLIWASSMAWALESTPCKKARLLAIYDDDYQHRVLIRYFKKRGFISIKQVGSSFVDLPLRLVWGGAGNLMLANCNELYKKSIALWHSSTE